MNRTQPDSLFQSMEKWIELYREIHGGSHSAAHDAFEAWAEELRGDTADQTTVGFHKAVIDEVVKMSNQLGRVLMVNEVVLDETVVKDPVSSKLVFDLVAKHVVHHPRGPIGGPLLDTGVDPLAFKDGVRESYFPVDKPHAPLPETVSVEELRRQAVETLEKNKAYLESPHLYCDELKDEAQRTIAVTQLRIEMLDGVLERQKSRGGKPLSLKGKHYPEGVRSTLSTKPL